MSAIYRNIKTGNVYVKLFDAIDKTNARDGTRVVVYRQKESGNVFVRDADEFATKFERMEERG